MTETGVRPKRVVTDNPKCYCPALRRVLPNVEHRRSHYLNNGIERDHGHLKQRLYPMRGCKQAAATDLLVRGHAFIQNLRNGFSKLTATVPRHLRVMTAWSQLAQAI
jgi:putative transposase